MSRTTKGLRLALFAVILSALLLASSFHLLSYSSLTSSSSDVVIIVNDDILPIATAVTHTHSSTLEDPLLPPQPSDAVLLSDWDLLLLLPPSTTHHYHQFGPLSCLFQDGSTSPASDYPGGAVLPWSRRRLLHCTVPQSLRRHRSIGAPRLVHGDGSSPSRRPRSSGSEIARWNLLAYESLSTPADVVVFVKGVNNRQGSHRSTSDLRCVFYADEPSSPSAVRTPVTVSAQEVFRCPHPDPSTLPQSSSPVKVTIELLAGATDNKKTPSTPRAIPSVAQYTPSPPQPPAHGKPKSLLCACTMVRDVAKFLPEWVKYHSRTGVDRFFLYDNGSEDDLDRVAARLTAAGHDVTAYIWPWPKTQEAGFSHCAALHRDSCEWMMFLDVDEFAFSPLWSNASAPSPTMLPSLLPSPGEEPGIGQVEVDCYDFCPSGLRQYPPEGVTQGYRYRLRAQERHKSFVRLEAVDESLLNVVHHFKLGEGYESRRLKGWQGAVNHYKYQAWPEFRRKFDRRVSAYVADWKKAVNPGSKDRVPGLGYEAVEPEGWEKKFCEVKDERLREMVRQWFGRGGGESDRMEWMEE